MIKSVIVWYFQGLLCDEKGLLCGKLCDFSLNHLKLILPGFWDREPVLWFSHDNFHKGTRNKQLPVNCDKNVIMIKLYTKLRYYAPAWLKVGRFVCSFNNYCNICCSHDWSFFNADSLLRQIKSGYSFGYLRLSINIIVCKQRRGQWLNFHPM